MKNQKKNKRGFLLHAFGNKELDYGKLAVCCALSIKTNLKNNYVTVVMDEETKKRLSSSLPKNIYKTAFDKIIISKEKFPSGKRLYFDSPAINFKANFNNQNRVLSYIYSPYDETILLDIDYIIMNNSLDDVWGNSEDILMNSNVIDLKSEQFGNIEEQRISNHGIPLYWATLVYFKKSEFSETFFELLEYIRYEYIFFQFLYGFKQGFYRNDFSYSIAAHIMSGFIPNGIKSFPERELLTSYQQDAIAEILDSREIIFYSHNVDKPWENTLVNIKDMNVHIMNKRELLRVSDKFIKSCMEKL